MNLSDAPLGYAFEGDYPESYGHLTPYLHQVLRRQLAELDRIGSATRQAELVGILRGRRSGREELPQLDIGSRRDGSDYFLARGDLVMPADSYGIPGVRHILEVRGFQYDKVRRGDLVRLRQPTAFRTDVERALYECGSLGATGWPNYLVTLAAVGKGIGGPEPVAGLGSFADYRIASAPAGGGEPGPKVAVIDTGIPSIDPADGFPGMRRSDGWLDSVQRTGDNRDLLDVLPNGPDEYLDFQAGHGTFVAGIVQRVAPGADIRVYRAADSDGFAADDDIADAMVLAAEEGADIINLSLGGRTADDAPPPAMARAATQIHDDSDGEVVIVAAAGNYGDDSPCWPGALPEVEAVAGLTAYLTPASWSSYGRHVRFSTVAEGIRSTFVTGRESPVFDRTPEVFPDDAWALWSGTSFAAPQIAGAVARICRETGMVPRKAVDKLAEQGRPVDGFGSAMRILEGVG